MRRAIDEARAGLGRTSPNPSVGAVVVKDGEIVAWGHTAPAGGPHAEIVALERAGSRAKGADLYVTLEPCNHVGKTGPCAPRVIEAGIARVFVGLADPNPIVSGRGIRRLRRAGLAVEVGLLRDECFAVIEPWARFITAGRPFVTLKVASTLDGRIATRTGDSQWITGEKARALVHGIRNVADAVIVGAGTVAADDPRLTCRLPDGRDPARVVLSSRLEVSPRARMFHLGSAAPTLVACVAPAPEAEAAALRAVGAEIVECRGVNGRIDLGDLLVQLANRGFVHVLVEGGARVFGAFLAAGLCDRLLLHYGPKVFGGGPAWTDEPAVARVADAPAFRYASVSLLGGDLLVEARPAEKRVEPKGRSRVGGGKALAKKKAAASAAAAKKKQPARTGGKPRASGHTGEAPRRGGAGRRGRTALE